MKKKKVSLVLGSETKAPMAIAIIGGLVSATAGLRSRYEAKTREA